MIEVQASKEVIQLDTGLWVRESEYQEIIAAVDAFITTMLPNHSYSVETMVGQIIWLSPLKWHAGAVVAHAVRRGRLPLRFAYNGRRATNLYELDN